MISVRSAIAVGAAMTAATAAVAGPATATAARPAATTRSCANKEYFSRKIDYYAVSIRVSGTSCSAADALLAHHLSLSGWHVVKHLAQSGVASKVYRVTATRGAGRVTLVWSVLNA